jgi:hypothetical protein
MIKKSNFLLLIIISLICFLCLSCVTRDEREKSDVKNVIDSIMYGKDKRTGICFSMYSTPHATSISAVPCEKVEMYLK